MMPDDKLLLPSEVASLFRVHVKTVARWSNEGLLHATQTPGGHRRYFQSEVLALANRYRNKESQC